jgi:hypothetical protein
MELTRRGFFSTLAGAVLGCVVGPKLLAQPPDELWAAIPRLPLLPVENSFVPLEAACAEILRIVDKELQWLRLNRLPFNSVSGRWPSSRFGDTVMVRKPAWFDKACLREPELVIHEDYLRVELNRMARVDLPAECFGDMRSHPFRVARRSIEPLGQMLAAKIVAGIRHNGGAETLICAEQSVSAGADIERVVVMSRPDAGLSLRGALVECAPYSRAGVVQFDMLYGLGG